MMNTNPLNTNENYNSQKNEILCALVAQEMQWKENSCH